MDRFDDGVRRRRQAGRGVRVIGIYDGHVDDLHRLFDQQVGQDEQRAPSVHGDNPGDCRFYHGGNCLS